MLTSNTFTTISHYYSIAPRIPLPPFGCLDALMPQGLKVGLKGLEGLERLERLENREDSVNREDWRDWLDWEDFLD